MDGYGDAFLDQTLQLTLTVAELVDLIEAGTVAEVCSGYEPPILAELRKQFTELVQDINEAADQV